MAQRSTLGFITEPEKQRRVLYDVDVVVAGSGICGTFAAIAAGRCGARTLVVDRFGSLGGNIGPGMIVNGSMFGEADTTLPGGLSGIAREFSERLAAHRVGPVRRYPEGASIASFLAYEMMTEAGVDLLLSAYAADPIMEGHTVRGLFVECKSGRVAVKARVTVDGTGDADIALRAGAPIARYLEWDESYAGRIRGAGRGKRHPTFYNDTQLLCLIAHADLDRFNTFCEADTPLPEGSEEGDDLRFADYPPALGPALREAWNEGDYRPRFELEPNVSLSVRHPFRDYGSGIAGLLVTCSGAIDAGDPQQISRLEAGLREQAFRALVFYRKNAPGFDKAYLLACSAFLGMRGGPRIEGEHTLTLDDAFGGLKCEDVLYRNIHEMNHGGEPSGFDVPYGIVLPKGIEGLLVCGRGAAYWRRGHEPTGMRARPSMMVFGQTVGTAAAIAALDNVTPKNVDILKIQNRLVADGIYLGDDDRLKELGIT